LSKTALARRAGLGRTSVSNAFSPGAAAPTKDTVSALAQALGVPPAPLLALLATAGGNDRRDRLSSTWCRPINDWDPLDLEIHAAAPAFPVVRENESNSAGLPGYVPRPHDKALASHVDAAANGSSRMAVLIGGSSTGKTRACWEAIQRLADAGWRLWRPVDPTQVSVALADLEQVGPRTVVWLNEAQHYLGAGLGLGERFAAALSTLLADPQRGPVLVLGTLWPEHANRYMSMALAGQVDPHAQTKVLIANRRIPVPNEFDAAAIAAAQALADAGDQQLAAALHRTSDGRLTQDLAGGPELLQRYRTARPAAQAMLQAAMDARRLGASLYLPFAFLQQAAEGYLSEAEFDALPDDWFEQSLVDLANLVHGNLAPLRQVRVSQPEQAPGVASSTADQRRGPVYRLADFLEHFGRHERRLLCPPGSFWRAAYDNITDSEDLARLAQAALCRYRLCWAFHLQQASKVCGPAGRGIQTYVVRMRETAGDVKAVDALIRREADTGSVWALLWLAARRERVGDQEGAERLLWQAADAGHIGALVRLLALRDEAGDTKQVELLTDQVFDATGCRPGLLPSMYLRTEKDEPTETKRSTRLAPYTGYIWTQPHGPTGWRFAEDRTPIVSRISSTVDGAPLVATRGRWPRKDSEEVESLARESAKSPEASTRREALAFLSQLREKEGDLKQAEVLARQAAELGRSDMLVYLGMRHRGAGDHEKAKRLLRDAVDTGDPCARLELEDLLRRTGDTDGAEVLAQHTIQPDQVSAYLRLADLRQRAGKRESVQTLVQQAADAGAFPDALFSDGLEPWTAEGGDPWLVDRITTWWPHGLEPDGTPSRSW
jgi:hypothetical protein